jgi:two-component system cell cycle response regulator DivK
MSKRILVVEDTEDNRQIVRDLLSSAGYELIEAVDGLEGVATAEKEQPDLILMDIQLPGVDGYEATRRIRAIPALAHTPIIAVTSYALSGDEAKTREAGCDAYVAKPFSPRQLLAKDPRIPAVTLGIVIARTAKQSRWRSAVPIEIASSPALLAMTSPAE